MSAPQQQALAQFLEQVVRGRPGGSATDGQLLERFHVQRDEAAFTALVERHGPMVLGVCRRVLGNAADADDAFQATFLVLVRKAPALLSRPVLGDYLHGVARCTALKAKTILARQRAKDQALARPEGQAEEVRNDWLPLLDRELSHLPEKYRLPIVLCDLEEKTRHEAAAQLGWPEGTVAGRLSRGRALLARRLLRKAQVVAGVAPLAAGSVARAALPPALLGLTVQAAAQVAAGETAEGALHAQALTLAKGVLQAMRWNRMKLGLALLLVALCGIGLGALGLSQTAAPPATGRDVPPREQAQGDRERLQGTWVVAEAEFGGAKMDAEELRKRPRTLLFRDDRARFVEGNKSDPPPFHQGFGTCRLDLTRKPKALDIRYGDEGPGTDVNDRFPGYTRSQAPPGLLVGTVRCIYELDGDRLKVCLRGFNADRPDAFVSRAKSKPPDILLILKRKALQEPPAPVPEKKPQTDPKKPDPPDKPKEGQKAGLKLVRSFEVTGIDVLHAVAFAPNGRLAAGGTFRTVRLWDVDTGQEVRRFETKGDTAMKEVYGLAFSPDGKRLVTGSGDGLIRILDVATMQEVRRLEGHKFHVFGVAWAPDGRHVLSGGIDATVRLWDVETGKEVRRFEGHKGPVAAVALSADGKFALSGGGLEKPRAEFLSYHTDYEDTAVRVWDVKTGKEVGRFEGHPCTVLAVAFSPDGRHAISGSKDCSARIWEVKTGKEVHRFYDALTPLQVNSVAYSPDGRRALFTDQYGVRLVDPETGKELARVEEQQLPLWGAAFAPDGRRIVSSSRVAMRLWRVTEE